MKKTFFIYAAANIALLAALALIPLFLLSPLRPCLSKILDSYLFIQYPNSSVFLQTESGRTGSVPWENDPVFAGEIEKYHIVLMAAYKTVLIDPLPGEETNVSIAAKKLAGQVVMPGDIFSQNSCLGPYLESQGYQPGPTYFGNRIITTIGGGVCKIASTLYNVAVLCDLPIIERHCHRMPVPYVPYGQDATVLYGVYDFKFKNNTPFPILIWSESIGNNLYIAFYGSETPPLVEWHHQVTQFIKAENEYTHNPDLNYGEERLLLKGMDGADVQSWVTVYNKDGTVTTKQMGSSHYEPLPFLYEKKLY